MGTRIINDDVLEEELFIEYTPLGHTVFSMDADGKGLSLSFHSKELASAWKAGWEAAMNKVEERSHET